MHTLKIYLILFLGIPTFLFSQKKQYQIRTIAFYNLENVFDTINDPNKFDERSPIMELKGNKTKAYYSKLHNMAKVLTEIGTKKAKSSPAIIGVAEVENDTVLADLIHTPPLKDKHYAYIHFNSPDARGIDVALLYQKKYFNPIGQKKYELRLWDAEGKRIYTRDQLLVSGVLDDELIYIIVNHWPSRRGGEKKSRPLREKAAWQNLKIIEDIHKETPDAKIIIMGDFNDDPINSSFKKVLKAKGEKKKIKDRDIYNPMENMFRRGFNTLGYRDNINLFDQILISSSLLATTKTYTTYSFFSAHIFNPQYLTTKSGRYKGYPFRSYGDGIFLNGYSDHYPVYIYLIKERN